MTKASGTPRNTAGTPSKNKHPIEKKRGTPGTPGTPKKRCVGSSSALKPAKPAPTEGQLKAIAEGGARLATRPVPPTLAWEQNAPNQMTPTSPHSDHNGMITHLLDALGTSSLDFVSSAMGSLECMTRGRNASKDDKDALPINSALALIYAIRPENELEAALATQMAGTHALTCELLGRAKGTDRSDHIQLYGGLAVKLQRAFAGQIDALTRLRRGGEQVVRHIHVDNRGGQAVVADTINVGGRENEKGGEQSHGPDTPPPGGPQVLSQDTAGNSVPIPSDAGSKALPHPRGIEPGAAERE